MSTTAPLTANPVPHKGWLRRHRFPLLVVAAVVLARVTILVMERFQVGLDYHFNAVLGFQFLAMVAALGLAVWFLAFSGYPFRVKAAGVGAVVGLVVAGVAAVRKVEFDGKMNPILRWRWDPSDEELLARQRAGSGGPVGGADLTVRETDSPRFRGPDGDGVAPGVVLDVDWSARPPKVIWRKYVGTGHGGMAVAGNSVVTMEQDGDAEAVVCYDRGTGAERWRTSYPARFRQSEPMGGDGPRTTPAIVEGMVYTLGATGELACLDGLTGTPRWRVNVLSNNRAANAEWGMSGSPAVGKSFVIVNPGVDPQTGTKQAVAAYNRANGARTWAAGGHPAAYASPQVVALGGVEQVLVFDADGLGGHDPQTGDELWRFPWRTPMGMNSAQPVVVGPDRVLVSSEIGNGAAVVEVRKEGDKWAANQVWRTRALYARFCSPVVHDGHVYGLSGGRMVCVDPGTGKQLWAEGNYGDGQLILAGDKLVVSDGKGKVRLVEANPGEYRELGEVAVFQDRTWNTPALAGKQLFIRSHREMACVELPVR